MNERIRSDHYHRTSSIAIEADTQGTSERTILDLSHVVEDGMITYPGLPGPVISDFLSREESRSRYEPGTEFQIGRIDMCSNTGTYIDTPFHRYPDGGDLAALPLERIADVEAVVIDASLSAERAVDREALLPHDLRGKAVLIRTGWSRHWSTDTYFHGHSYLTEAAAGYLVDHEVALVGIDSLNIDDTTGGARPVHSLLLAAGIPICEHLTNLEALPATGSRFSAVPVMVRGMGAFPVRAYAILGS